MMFTRAYWQDLADRALRTAAQTLVAAWAGGQVNLLDIDWAQSLGLAGGAALVSVVSSIAFPGPVGGRPAEESYVGKRRRDE